MMIAQTMKLIASIAVLLSVGGGMAEPNMAAELVAGHGLKNFREVEDWDSVRDAKAVPGEPRIASSGTGHILTNVRGKRKQQPYLITKDEFGDVEVHLEFMTPRDSNSGIYLMGRYEVQILDSFGKSKVAYSDLGGLYQRWDPSRGEGKAGYEGVAPESNAAKAPGQWQTLDITFRAPRFDAAGKKTENARFVTVAVNGVAVHDNVELDGPTRSHPLVGEATRGPIALQGDHGPIAIRSLKVKVVRLD